jgi:hypothetical protein
MITEGWLQVVYWKGCSLLIHFLKIGLEDLRDNAKLVQNSRSPAAIRNRNSIPERCRCVKRKEKAGITSFEAYSEENSYSEPWLGTVSTLVRSSMCIWHIDERTKVVYRKRLFRRGVYDTLVSTKLTRLRHVFRHPQHVGGGGVAAPARRTRIRYCTYPKWSEFFPFYQSVHENIHEVLRYIAILIIQRPQQA